MRNRTMVSSAINLGSGAVTGGASLIPSGGGSGQSYGDEVIGMNRQQFTDKYGY